MISKNTIPSIPITIQDCSTCVYGKVEHDDLPMDKVLSMYTICGACRFDDDIDGELCNWCPITT